jgi:hypothetical protein
VDHPGFTIGTTLAMGSPVTICCNRRFQASIACCFFGIIKYIQVFIKKSC